MSIEKNILSGTMTLTDKMCRLLESGLQSDVTFVVGQNKERIKAHKLLLSTSSPVFEQLLTQESSKGELELPQIEPEVFRMLLKYIYTGEFPKESKRSLALLNAANFYNLEGLSESCVRSLKTRLTEDTALTMFQQAVLFNEQNFKKDAKAIVCRYAYKIVKSAEFLTLGSEHLEELVGRDDFAVKDEIQLFEALIHWAETECVRQGTAITPKYCRSFLEKLIPLIRFPQMTEGDFSLKVAHQNILTTEELLSVWFYYKMPTYRRFEAPSGIFNSKPRYYHLPTKNFLLKRLPIVRDDYYIEDSGDYHRVCFKVEETVWMTSIGLNPTYQDLKDDSDEFYTIKIMIEDSELENILAEQTEIVAGSANTTEHYQIKFKKSVKIEKNIWYTASLVIVTGKYCGQWFTRKGEDAFCEGSDGRKVRVEFKNQSSVDATLDTNSSEGQMATLGFLLY